MLDPAVAEDPYLVPCRFTLLFIAPYLRDLPPTFARCGYVAFILGKYQS